MAPFERAMVVSYRLSIATVALSVTIRSQFAIECLRRMMFGSAESEHPRLTNGKIISEEFQPM